MNKEERQEKFLEFMSHNGKQATIEQLKSFCDVTNETIRKDLIEMEQENKVRRVLGGAVLNDGPFEKGLQKRYYNNLSAKREIARCAGNLIEENDFVCLDSGSTNVCFAMSFPNISASVLTNSTHIAQVLVQKPNIRVFVAGGELREKNLSMTGANTERVIQSYHVKKTFLTSEGVDLEFGVMDGHEAEIRVKQSMISIAKEVYLLVDHSKFSMLTPICTTSLKNITAIITDSNIDPSVLEAYHEAQIRVIVAEPLF